MTQLHDDQVAWQPPMSKLDELNVLTADRGYDFTFLRQRLAVEGIKLLIQSREFDWEGPANYILVDDTTDYY